MNNGHEAARTEQKERVCERSTLRLVVGVDLGVGAEFLLCKGAAVGAAGPDIGRQSPQHRKVPVFGLGDDPLAHQEVCGQIREMRRNVQENLVRRKERSGPGMDLR